jgi:nicotinate-nucleotide adenylyltransferase
MRPAATGVTSNGAPAVGVGWPFVPGDPSATRPAPDRPERIGLLGGTFDPPHAGHLAAATSCRDALALDRVLLVVANDPWQKSPHRQVTDAEVRFEMVVAAAEGIDRLEASRLEIDRGGPSYTVETVRALLDQASAAGRPAPDIFLLVGADLATTLHTWERVDELRRLVRLVIVTRPPDPAPVSGPEGWDWQVVGGEGGVDVSSSGVREALCAGRPVAGLVPAGVVHCILARGLYAVGR